MNWGIEVLQTSALPLGYAAIYWCPEPESNQRHEDFQSSALPTELSGHNISYRFSVDSYQLLGLSFKSLRPQITLKNR